MNRTNQTAVRDPPCQIVVPPLGLTVRVIVVAEGIHDVGFLKRIASMLHAHDPALPHLADMEQRGELIFVPCAGSVVTWASRLQPLWLPEFHLYDREVSPETEYRQRAVKEICRRHNCEAVLTRKRCLENYLHPDAIRASADIEIDVDNCGYGAETAAKTIYRRGLATTPWELLTRRVRKRMTQRAKRWLNTKAVDHMTVERLRDRDPNSEIISWLTTIRRLTRTG